MEGDLGIGDPAEAFNFCLESMLRNLAYLGRTIQVLRFSFIRWSGNSIGHALATASSTNCNEGVHLTLGLI